MAWCYDGRVPDQPTSGQVYMQPFSGPGGRIQVSIEGGIVPLWSRDGRELFYVGRGLMAVDIQTNPTLRAGRPHALPSGGGNFGQLWDVAPDGKRFLTAKPSTAVEPTQVVVNWFDELRRKAPPLGR
jgi:hypothetical protein